MPVLHDDLTMLVRLEREAGRREARRHRVPFARLTGWHVRPDGRLGATVRAGEMEWADRDEGVVLVPGDNARAVEGALGPLTGA